MSTTGSSRPVPRPLHLPSSSNSSSPRSSPVIAKSPLSGPIRYNNTHEGKESPASSSRLGSQRQSSLSYSTSSPNTTQSPQYHIRRNTVSSNDSLSLKSPTTQGSTSRSRTSLQSVKDTEPATLAERHADLLRFIAQKESKCLELRTQLAQHEAELLLLKQKWERIVSKGSPALPSTSASIEPAPITLSRSDVLGGIREGVQSGFEKVLAVLEPAIVGSSGSSDSSSTSSSGSPISTTTSMPLPSKASVLKHNKNTESLSSTISSSVSSLFDDTQSNGTRSLDSPIVEDEHSAQRISFVSANSSELNAKVSMPAKNRTAPLSSTLSQLSSTLSSPDTISKSVASWVSPSLNKKWEELRNNETISKQSKRASLLFNDMLSALSASSSSSSTPASASPTKIPACRSPISPIPLDPAVGTFIGTGTSSTSLLDEGIENQLGVALQPDHVPIQMGTGMVPEIPQDADDEEDNWDW